MAMLFQGVKQYDVNELKNILKTKPEHVVVIDVREKDEYEEFHIPGVPLIPMHTIPNILDQLKKDKEYIFVCRSGSRSQSVARYLKENGFEHAHNFSSGMLTWDADISTGLENVITDVAKLYE